MAKNIKGITIELNASTTGLDKALSDVNKQSRDIAKELREVEKGLKFNPKDTVLLSQKQKLLGDQIATTKEKLDRLKEAEKQVQQQFEKGDIGEEQYRSFQREVVETESKLKHYKDQLKETNRENSTFGQTLDNVSKKLETAGKKLQDVGKSMTTKVTLPIVGAGIASFKFASDIEDAMGASDQIFKGSSEEVKIWADNLIGYYGIAEGEALEYANVMGAMLQNIGGLTEQEAAKQSQTLVQLAGDLTAMFGGTTESAVQALTGALKGNNSMLDNYGMGVNEATIKSKALEMGLVEEGEQLDLAGKQAATLALIMEQTADAQGQAAREADGSSGSLRLLITEVKNLAGDLGEVLLPIVTPFITKLGEMIQKFKDLTPEQKDTIVKIGLLVAAIGPAIVILGTIIGVFGKLASIIKVAGSAISFLASPIGLAIAAIVAMIAIGVLLYKNWDTIKEKASELWENIKERFNKIKESIMEPINNAKDKVKEAIEKIKSFFDFKWSFPKLKMPTFSITGKFSLSPLSVPKLGIKWNADGGIFNSPTVLPTLAGLQGFGEPRTGGEAIMPLNKLPSLIADAMAMVGGGGSSIVIQNMSVRDDTDIEKVAIRLDQLQSRRRRGRG